MSFPFRRRLPLVLAVVMLTLVVTALSRLTSLSGEASLIWPVTGLVVGFVLSSGRLWALPVAAGAVLWAFLAGLSPVLWALLVLEVLVTAWVTGIWQERLPLRGVSAFRRLMTIYFRGAVMGAGAAAIIGGGALAWSGLFPDYTGWEIAVVYWIAAAIGVVLLTPLLLDAFSQRGRLTDDDIVFLRKCLPAALPLLVLALVARAEYGWMFSYLLVPLLIWAALRASPLLVNGMIVLSALLIVYVGRQGVPTDSIGNAELVQVVVQILALSISIQVLAAVSRERYKMLVAAKERAVRDPLTGLLNESGVRERLGRIENGATVSLVLLRIEDFDNVGDLLGVSASDALERSLLLEFADGNERADFGRLGRGLYAGLFPESIAAVKARMLDFYRRVDGRGLSANGLTVMLRPTMSLLPVCGVDREGVLGTAVDSLSVALRYTGERFLVLEDPVEITAERRRHHLLIEEVKAALHKRELVLYLQPIAPLGASSEHGLHGEILLRWNRTNGTVSAPGEFLGVAESAGLMGAIDRYVIRELFAWIVTNRGASQKVRKFAINLSGSSVSDPTLPAWIAGQIRVSAIDPASLCFEITESQAIANRDAARQLIHALRDIGASVSLDDFGTGLATFDYLKSFPFDYLKIDGSFIRNLRESEVDQAIVASITRVAKTLSLSTIAEFVEDPSVLEWLRANGVDFAQGYGVGRPAPLDELVANSLLEQRPESTPALSNMTPSVLPAR